MTKPPYVFTDTFVGLEGPATLVLTSEDASNATVRLNGNQIIGVKDLKKAGFIRVPVDLVADKECRAPCREHPTARLRWRSSFLSRRPNCTGPASTGGIMLSSGQDGMGFETGGGVIPVE